MWRDNGNVSNSWAFGACKHVRDPNSHPLFQGGGCWSRVITHAATWVDLRLINDFDCCDLRRRSNFRSAPIFAASSASSE